MKLKNLNFKTLIITLIIFLIYPILKAIFSNNHLVALSDSMLIIGLISIIIGIFNSAVLHGDYDISSYLAHRKKFKNDNIDFKTYANEQKEKRKDSFNYPLLIGIIFLIISVIVGLISR